MSRQRVKAEPVSVSPVRAAASSRVNAPGDRFEVEAERLSRRVTGAPLAAPVEVQPGGLQLQRAAVGSAPIPAMNASLQLGGGEPLPAPVESQMAGSLGHRFGEVRIHRGDYADRVSRQLNARAFAYDQHLFFSDGAYDPHSAPGQRLIGHELVHTLQQQHMPVLQKQEVTQEEQHEQLAKMAESRVDQWLRELKTVTLSAEQLQKLSGMQGVLDILAARHAAIQQSDLSEEARTVYQSIGSFIRIMRQHLYHDSLWRTYIVGYSNVDRVLNNYVSGIGRLDNWDIDSLQNNVRKANLPISRYLYEESYFEIANEKGIEISEEGLQESGGAEIDHKDWEHFEDEIGKGHSATTTEFSNEQKKLIDAFIDSLADGDLDIDQESFEEHDRLSREQIYFLFESIPDVDRANVLRILPDLIGKPAHETKKADILDALESLLFMSEAERQMLITNKILHPDAKTTTEIPDEIQFALTPDSEKVFPDTGKKDENIDLMQNQIDSARETIRKKGSVEDQSILDQIFGSNGASTFPFLNELLLFEGLLIGAGEKNTAIKTIAQEITHDIAQIRVLLQKEIALASVKMIGTAALGSLAVSLSGGASLAVLATKGTALYRHLKRLDGLIEKVTEVYRIIENVQQVVAVVDESSKQFDQYVGQFDLMLQKWEYLQSIYDSADAPDDIEEQIEALEETLVKQMEENLGDKMGDILSQFYIPEDASEEELITILFSIPNGIDAFRDVLGYYNTGGNDANFRATMLGKAIAAGKLLYPVVGYLAFLTQDRLSEVISSMEDKSVTDLLFSSAPRMKRKRGGRRKSVSREENRDKLSPSKRRKAAEKDPAYESGIKNHLRGKDQDSGEGFMEQYLNEHGMRKSKTDTQTLWTDRWFKTVARSGVKELNKEKKKVKINGKPLPRFKLRNFNHKPKGPEVFLTLNPREDIHPTDSNWLDIDDLRLFNGESPSTKGILVPIDHDERKKQERELHKHFKIPDSWPIEEEDDYHKTNKSDLKRENKTNGYIYIKNSRYYWSDLLNRGTESDPIKIFWHKRKIDHMQQKSKIRLLPKPKPEDQITASDFETYSIKDISTIKIPDPKSSEAQALDEKQRQLSRKKEELALIEEKKAALDIEKNAGTFATENERITNEIEAADREMQAAQAEVDRLDSLRRANPGRHPSHWGKIGSAKKDLNDAQRKKRQLETQQTERQQVESADLASLRREIENLDQAIAELKIRQERNPKTKDERIGVKPDYYPKKGKKLERKPGRDDSEKNKFKNVLIAAGMEHEKNPDREKSYTYQMEHIIDNAYDGNLPGRGADTRHNLWPITATENPTPWQLVNAKTKVESGKKGVPNYKVGSSGGATRFAGSWFEIADFVPNGVALNDNMVYFNEEWFKSALNRR